tara:strand:+ start:1592 stop:2035 length:444 start_codon:yes stop_codon:yes gene_type:complete
MPSFLVKEIKPKDCYYIRHQVLWQHKSFDDCGIDIDDQAGAFHLGAYKGDELICVASFFKQSQAKFSNQHQYRLRAMATLSSAQNTGAARALLNSAFQILKAKGQDLLWCDARIIATGFYEKIGFEKLGDSYSIPIIGLHYLMYKTL